MKKTSSAAKKRKKKSSNFLWAVQRVNKLEAGLVAAVMVIVGGYVIYRSQAASNSGVQASTAASFVDSVGINIHMSYDRYSNEQNVLKDLHYLGVVHTRDDPGTTAAEKTKLDVLKGGGIRFDFLIPRPPAGVAGIQNVLDLVKSRYLAATDSIEGPNEYDGYNSTWVADLKAYQTKIYKMVNADSSLKNLPILGPSIKGNTMDKAAPALGNIASILDYGNIHSYPGGHTPETTASNPLGTVEHVLNLGRRYNFGNKPAVVTESGFTNALNNCTTPHLPTTERTSGIYTPRMYLEDFRLGIVRTYDYELMDKDTSCGGEAHFGMFRPDNSPKPSATATHNLTTLLADSGSFKPGTLKYSVTAGGGSDLHQVLLQKHDGSFWLALWRVDNMAKPAVPPVDLNVASSPLVLTFGEPVASATQYVPNDGVAAVSTVVNPKALNVVVGAVVTLVRVVPGATATPPPAADTSSAPDLVVTGIAPANAVAGSSVVFTATVKNQGKGAFPAGTIIGVQFKVDGTTVSWSDNGKGGLAPGASVQLTADNGPTGSSVWKATTGDHSVRAWVDDIDRLPAEMPKDNNQLTVPVHVGASGVKGAYFSTVNLTGTSVARTDNSINFNWDQGSPFKPIPVDNFSIRWTGSVIPARSEAYKFYVTSDDGARLWINNQLLVDSWVQQAPTEHSGQITLVAGQKYSLRLEYYEKVKGAIVNLSWSSPSTPKAIIPATALTTQ